MTLDKLSRGIDWFELSQLKKDILWIFDENTGQLVNSFIPENSFLNKYWEYLTLYSDGSLTEEEIKFYHQGALIIILCMTVEYIDTIGGNQTVFGSTSVNSIYDYVNSYMPKDQNQNNLKSILKLGLKIATSMTQADLNNTDGFNHVDMISFYSQLDWVDVTFIKPYFASKAY